MNWIVILNCRILKTASGSNNFLTHCKSYPHTKEPGVLGGYFAALMVRNSVKGEQCMRKLNTKRAVPLDVVPELRTKRCSPRFRPGDRFCESSFRYLLPGSEGWKCRPLDQRKQIPFIHSVRLISSDNFYIYWTLFYLFPPSGAFKCVVVWCDVNLTITHALLSNNLLPGCDKLFVLLCSLRDVQVLFAFTHAQLLNKWNSLLSQASLTCICCVLKWNIKQKEECFIKYPNTQKWVEKCGASRVFFYQLASVLISDETQFRVFDIAFQSINNSWRKSKQILW